ncbi:aldo/keto reductase family protein [Muribaculum intestinale]|jgi:diketogulonate reductase-like aldo/keto reductase|uniref:aldo/keto reductase family protein n=1 Tax=Muribaculum intestinale TaxID=1796646 RepID=UPI0025B163C3|nr:aldo/keto reductase [Muribaculum intestinale]
MKHIKLNNGVEMPIVGLGTFLIPKEILPGTIKQAYDTGYRQFDTAWRYYNETDIADALKKYNIKREDVFLTTKLNVDAFYYFGYGYGWRHLLNWRNFKSCKRIVQESFDNLKTDYIDLFLVHHPWHNFLEMYSVLTDFYKEGKIRAIGVSSFLPSHIEALREVSDIVPAVNQFEISPLNTQKPLIDYCQKKGIAVQAMSTFSHFRSNEPRLEITQSEVIRPIAERHGKTIVQVVLRWLIQQNIIVIPKTWCQQHLRENISVFDFELSPEEMSVIDSLDKGRYLNYDPTMMVKYVPEQYRHYDEILNLR